ncbi:MAG: hypothetical protein ACE5FU_04280, partial [Nitrospinota bacterium]
MRKPFFLTFLFLFIFSGFLTGEAAAAYGKKCFGLLWCKVETEDSVLIDGFFYLFSSEKRKNFSRLAIRPFYFSESDSEKAYLRKTFLWPLGNHERKGLKSSTYVFPLYWQKEEPGRRYTVFPPFYINYEKEDRTYFHILPLYGHHSRWNDGFDRYFFLGPLFIATNDVKKGVYQRDILIPIFHYRSDKEKEISWAFPVYFYTFNKEQGRSNRLFLNYGSQNGPETSRKYLFPIFGSQTQKRQKEFRFSLLGFPPISAFSPLPTLAFYEHVKAPEMVSDRFFPFYRYERNQQNRTREFSLIGHRELSFFWYKNSQEGASFHLFPLSSYKSDSEKGRVFFGGLGYGRFSFYFREKSPALTSHHLFPLFHFRRNIPKESWRFSLFGLDPLLPFSLFRQSGSPDATYGVMFPFYHYQRKGPSYSLSLFGLSEFSLYRHKTTGKETSNRLFPLYGYKSGVQGYRFSALGLPPIANLPTLSLFEQVRENHTTTSRFFPIYGYSHNRLTKEVRWNALFLYQHKQAERYTKDALLPLYSYENDRERESWRFGLIGIPPVTLYDHQITPTETRDHLFPLYAYRSGVNGYRFSLLGFPYLGGPFTFSLFEQVRENHTTTSRFFPIY